jgi:hypothetical protein
MALFRNSGAAPDMGPGDEWRTPKQIIDDAQREAAEKAVAEQAEKDAEDGK